MALSNITNFIESMNASNGPAKSERFYANFSIPLQLNRLLGNYTRDLTFRCSATELPGRALHPSDYRIYGPPKIIPTMTLYNEITFTFYCSNKFWERPFFDTWLEYINPRSLGWDFRYKDEYVADINIVQLDMANNPIYTLQLIRAYPSTISPMPLGWGDDSVHSLDVSFVFEKYKPLNDVITNKLRAQILTNTLSEMATLATINSNIG